MRQVVRHLPVEFYEKYPGEVDGHIDTHCLVVVSANVPVGQLATHVRVKLEP